MTTVQSLLPKSYAAKHIHYLNAIQAPDREFFPERGKAAGIMAGPGPTRYNHDPFQFRTDSIQSWLS